MICTGIRFAPGGQKSNSPGRQRPQKWVILKGSSLLVNGSTNINHFSCEVPNYCNPDTIILRNDMEGNATADIPLSGQINLSISGFDCHNSMMTAEFRKILKAPLFPCLTIHFLSFNHLPVTGIRQQNLAGMVDIQLAGVIRRFQLDYVLSYKDNRQIILTGSRSLNFSDFGLVPPRKLGGMIRTNDRVDIAFSLNMMLMD